MPRRAREKSGSGIYHIVFRGTNKQEIFHDEEDNQKFIETLERFKKASRVKVHGWCLMDNHVHILLREGEEELSATMKRILVSYAWHYNNKYISTGHLFQDRYWSEKVDSNEYLLTVIRYIHQNPIKAGMVKKVSDWKWSSCQGYYGQKIYPLGLLDSEFILEIFSNSKEIAIKKFIEFNEIENEDVCLEDNKSVKLNDKEAKLEISKIIPLSEIAIIKSMPKADRDILIRKIKAIEGISQRQAARILGVAPNLILRS
jgi:REP element-mobilizing transposase RayT